MLKGLFAWAVLCLITSTAQAVVLLDDRQMEVTIKRPPQRIVSLLPSLSETVCVLGQCEKLVGVDRYSNWPHSLAQLPRLGGGIDPNIEGIVALKPDLVLMATSARGAERLQALGLTVLALEPNTYADVQRVTRLVAQALGISQIQQARVLQRMEAEIALAQHAIAPHARGQRVYFEVSSAPYGAGEASFIGDILRRLGAHNILPAALGPFPKINPEFVVRAQPDIIMVGDSSWESMLSRPGWAHLRALRTQRVCHFKPEESDVLVRAGPRMGEAARLMAQCLTDKTKP